MSRAEEIRAAEAHRRERRQTSTSGTDQHAPATPKVRAKPVRKTVDLPPQRYTALVGWCAEAAGELGVARVTGQDVLAGLVQLLLTDESTARRLRAQLADDFHQR